MGIQMVQASQLRIKNNQSRFNSLINIFIKHHTYSIDAFKSMETAAKRVRRPQTIRNRAEADSLQLPFSLLSSPCCLCVLLDLSIDRSTRKNSPIWLDDCRSIDLGYPWGGGSVSSLAD